MVSVGTIIWLSSELMFFAALFAAYFTIRAVSPDLWAQEVEKLNIPFCPAMNEKSRLTPFASSVSTKSRRIAWIRSRIPAERAHRATAADEGCRYCEGHRR